MRNGGLNCLLRPELDQYFQEIAQLTRELGLDIKKMKKHGKGWSVYAFYQAVMADPPLKMCIEAGLAGIPEGGGLYGCTFEFLCEQLICIITTPPRCRYNSLDGVPFYTLFVDLLETKGGMGFFLSPVVNEHLKNIFGEYAAMLNSKESLKWVTDEPNGGWLYENQKPGQSNDEMVKPVQDWVDYSRFQCDTSKPHYGFKSWMDWFTRKIKPSRNKLPKDDNENMIVSSSDSFPLYYPIAPLPEGRQGPDLGKNPRFNVKMDTPFWLKDNQYSLIDMFGGLEMENVRGNAGFINFIQKTFEGGTVFQSFLNPWCYHRWQAPISGHIKYSYKLDGTYYLQNPTLSVDIRRDNYADSQPMLSAVSVRQIYIIESDNKNIGHVAVIEIGMAEVSSVNSSVKQGEHIDKGAELGFFAFGGSSYVMVFSNNIKQD